MISYRLVSYCTPLGPIIDESYIKKVIKMVISTETICAPEQGYMFFVILQVYIQQCLFSKFSLSECKEKVESTIKLTWVCIFLHRKNLSTLSCKSNNIKLHKLHKIESLLTKDYKVLFTNYKRKRTK